MSVKPFQVVIASGKGGVGKTLISASMVRMLSREMRLISVDADAEAPNLHLMLSVDSWDEEREVIASKLAQIHLNVCTGCGLCAEACQFNAIDMVEGMPVVKRLYCEGCHTCSIVCPVNAIELVDVRGGYLRVKREREYVLISAENEVGRPGSGKLVYEAKSLAINTAISEGYPLILVDAPAGIGCQVIAALNGAQYLLVVVEPTLSSLSDAMRLLKVAEHFRIPAGVVLNKVGLGERLEEVYQWVSDKGLELVAEVPYSPEVPRYIGRGELPLDVPEVRYSLEAIKEHLVGILRNE